MTPQYIWLALACLLLPLAAQAEHPAIHKANNQINLSVGFLHQNYGEYNDGLAPSMGAYLDVERGKIPGFDLSASASNNKRQYVEFHLSRYSGRTDYDGALQWTDAQGYHTIPYQTTTENVVTELLLKGGKVLAIGERSALTPHLELGWHGWRRDTSDDPYGYLEDYSHFWIGLGLIGQHAISDRLVVEAAGMVGHSIDAFIVVPDHALRGSLGSSLTWQAGIGADYTLRNKLHLTGNIHFVRFNYDQSPSNGYALEPRSFTEQVSYRIGLGYPLD